MLFLYVEAFSERHGHKPYRAMWLYKVLVRPIITYASAIWLKKTKQKTASAEIEKLRNWPVWE
jgi:hypothetical protein